MNSECINCGDPDTEEHELMVRNQNHDRVPLCEGCHEAISGELSGE